MDKKKMFVILGGIVGVIVVIVIAMVIFVSFNSGRGKSFEVIETTLVSAAQKYYEKNKGSLPTADSIVEVSADTLTSAGVMTELKKLAGEDRSCTGKVVVKKVGDKYTYAPYLDCGDKYKTKYLYQEIQGLYSEDGKNDLYNIANEIVYRGEDVSNYVSFAGKTWRIVKVTETNKVVLLLNDKLATNVWDDRFNNDRNQSVGINDYTISRAKETLERYYGEFFEAKHQNLIVPESLCIGHRASEDVNRDINQVECLERLDNQYIGLLTAIDYMNASLDQNCQYITHQSCQNYSYMAEYASNVSWWLMTGVKENSYQVYKVISTASEARAATNGALRPVIYLGDNAVLAGGNGTVDSPFTIR